ncbi:hypothetical protein [Enterococcus sp. CR-Ec1]|jgi:hypothetical protein|uniref:hypothetical protein n=1 Tax=Enterococcus sp. CR-Ec1 TaxID=2057791 RepID=UPI000C772D9A|nr:hypothetical protein [Enterococcus sp. CR-Ec1]AUJ87122.1 hypothetical protein CXM95_17410 [Enterococcus sp. CR-Ec1]
MIKVLFVDKSPLAGSVVKIIARNILMSDRKINVSVVEYRKISKYKFSDEKLVIVDPLIPLDSPALLHYIPSRIERISFHTGHYAGLNSDGVMDLIENFNGDTTYAKGTFR